MLKKTITYIDFNDVERTEDFYFNLSKAELMEMEMSVNGGFGEMMEKIVNAKDAPSIIKVFKDLVLKAYGEKSPDGKRFLKKASDGHPLCLDFEESAAYSELFMELSTDAEAAAAFVNGIVPKDLQQEIK